MRTIKKQYGLTTRIRRKHPYNIALKRGGGTSNGGEYLQQHFNADIPDQAYSTDISRLIYKDGQREFGMIQSMSRKGNCLDEAPIGSFFGHMKDDMAD